MTRSAATATLLAFLFLALLFSPRLSMAQGTRLWVQSHYEEFEKGKPDGVAIASDGYIEAGPQLHSVLLTPSTYIWALASDAQGNAWVATGSPATVLKITPDGASTRVFTTKDLSVQTLRIGPDGSVYAATLPSGKVYRLKPRQGGSNANPTLDESTAEVVFDPAALASATPAGIKEAPKYIWDLAFDSAGDLYIATGAPAAIYRVRPQGSARPELFFSSDEQHIRCLLFEKNGDLMAGSDGSGLAYRIGKDGKGFVVFNAPKHEITALAESPSGALYVGSVGEKSRSNLPPLPVQGNAVATATITIVTPGSVQASSSNGLVPEGSEVDELSPEGAPRKLWATKEDVLYSLHATPDGLLAATGNRGRIYRIQEDGSYLDVAHTASGQVTAFAPVSGSSGHGALYVATSNTGRLYRLGGDAGGSSTYLSDVFDAGVFSQWGRVEVNADELAHSAANRGFELYTRSGNVDNPERNWSAWQRVAPNAGKLPSARFVQWKAVLQPGARLSSVGVNYLPVNVAPVIDEVVVQPGARVNTAALPQPTQQQQVSIALPSAQAGVVNYNQDPATQPLPGIKDRNAVTVRWAAHDDNGDELLFSIYVRGDGESNWRLLRKDVKERFYTFDSVEFPDGGYRMQVVATDAPSHPAGEALTGERQSDHFDLDTTPPVLSTLNARLENGAVHATLDATDPHSTIAHAEYSLDAGPWQYLDPTGKLSDASSEHYDFTAPLKPRSPDEIESGGKPGDTGEHVLTVRVYNRYENVSAVKAVVR